MLARTWFHCTVEEMLPRLASEDITELAAEYSIEPWEGKRGDLQAGIVASTVYNVAAKLSSSKARTKPPADFMPRFTEERKTLERRRSPDELRAYLIGYTLAVGGKVKTQHGNLHRQTGRPAAAG